MLTGCILCSLVGTGKWYRYSSWNQWPSPEHLHYPKYSIIPSFSVCITLGLFNHYSIISFDFPGSPSNRCLLFSNKLINALVNVSWYSSTVAEEGHTIFGTSIGLPTEKYFNYWINHNNFTPLSYWKHLSKYSTDKLFSNRYCIAKQSWIYTQV